MVTGTKTSSRESVSAPPKRRGKLKRAILFGVMTLALLELVASLLYQQSVVYPGAVWYWEHTGGGPTMEFDAIRGYRLTENSRRMVCMGTNGKFEAVATVRGNNEGFPDRDDFSARRGDKPHKRLAVFGDSFTAGLYLERGWPDVAEDVARRNQTPLELMNFSIFAGGLVNWTSVLTGVIEAKEYELDGVVFAVFRGDLHRGFTMADDRNFFHAPGGYTCMAVGRVPIEETRLPTTLEEARPYFSPVFDAPIVNTDVLDQILRQRPRTQRALQPVLSRLCWHGIKRILGTTELGMANEVTDSPKFPPEIRRRLKVIRNYLQARKLPALVIAVPSKDRLLDRLSASDEGKAFAEFVGAEFVDGAEAFDGLSASDVRDHWLRYDGHWAQSGSDRFARHVSEIIADWADRHERSPSLGLSSLAFSL